MKKLLFSLFISLTLVSTIHAQDALAKIEYGNADEAYQKGEYKKALEHLDKIKKHLGGTNATVMYLEILTSYYALPYFLEDNDVKNYLDYSKYDLDNFNYLTQIRTMAYLASQGKTFKPSEVENKTPVINFLTESGLNEALTVQKITKLTKTYISKFSKSAPLEKIKEIRDIQKKIDPSAIAIELIIEGLYAIENKEWDNGISLINKACEAGNKFAVIKARILKAKDMILNHRDEIVQNILNNMVLVEGGTFKMGNNQYKNQKEHKVILSNFNINKYEVTNLEYYAVVGGVEEEGMHNYFLKYYNFPIEITTRSVIEKFIKELNQLTNRNFILPTEAQWEYAARGGNMTQNYQYSGSNNVNEVAFFENEEKTTKLVVGGRKKPNELGLYDMSGNITEICQDLYDEKFYNSSNNAKDPICTKTKFVEVVESSVEQVTNVFGMPKSSTYSNIHELKPEAKTSAGIVGRFGVKNISDRSFIFCLSSKSATARVGFRLAEKLPSE